MTETRPNDNSKAWKISTTKVDSFGTALAHGLLFGVVILLMVVIWQIRHMPYQATDTLIYHLTIPALWLQNGFLSPIDLPHHDAAAEHSPKLCQIIHYLILKCTGNDALSRLVQPMFMMGIASFYWIYCKRAGLSAGPSSLLAASIMLFAPFANSFQYVHNDLIITFGAAWMLHGLTKLEDNQEDSLYHISAGIAVMTLTKTTGIIYAVAGILAAVVVLAAAYRSGKKSIFNTKRCAISVVILLVGLVFVLENWFRYGNPLYPAQLNVFGFRLFDGLYDPSVIADHGWRPAALLQVLFSGEHLALTPKISIILWTSATVVAWKVCTSLKNGHSDTPVPRGIAPLTFVISGLLLYFLKVPFWSEPRLLFPAYYGLWLLAPTAISHISKSASVYARYLPALAAIIIFSLLSYSSGLAFDLLAITCVLIAVAIYFTIHRISFVNRFRTALIIAAASLFVITAYFVSNSPANLTKRITKRISTYPIRHGDIGKSWAALDAGICGKNLTIAYSGTAQIYPLFGPNVDNQVIYVPIDPTDQDRPVEPNRGRSPDLCRLLFSARRSGGFKDDFWLKALQRQHVNTVYLVNETSDVNNPGIAEITMIHRTPDRFSLLFRSGPVSIWRFTSPLD